MTAPRPAVIVDVDGTLVDSNYHHVVAWFRAFRRHGVTIPIWRIHRHVGMGGDQLVPALAGSDAERRNGDGIRELQAELFKEVLSEVVALPDAQRLLRELKARGHAVVLATSARPHELERYLDLLDARDVVDGWTASGDVDATKPEPDLVMTAREKAGGGDVVMVGDSVWDVEAGRRAGVPTIALLTGGFGPSELADAGAVNVFASIAELLERLEETPLA